MIEIKGKYNQAMVFAKKIDRKTEEQIITMCNTEELKDTIIRIMPDCHAGAGCTIGTTMKMARDTPLNPYYVGVDIGCGVKAVQLAKEISFEELDEVIKRHIPYGFAINEKKDSRAIELVEKLFIKDRLKNIDRLYKSLGSLGGGNHFIEITEDDQNNRYLVIHSGSRNLGHQVASIYGKIAGKSGFLRGEQIKRYLHDMHICQTYASLNRSIMIDVILKNFDMVTDIEYTSVHNYIEELEDSLILRKGAISAKRNEKVLIPINMRDGTVFARGKGNENWNVSAPHGAGRILSRTDAKKKLSLVDFKKDMRGIFSTRISSRTLDEAPKAYKPIEIITEGIEDTVEILGIWKAIYNFKA